MSRRLVLLLAAVAALACGLTALAAAETIQRAGLRIAFDAKLTPSQLPREGRAPVAVSVKTRIESTAAADPPQLRKIAIAINANGSLDASGTPRCEIEEIQPATGAKALAACRPALVGRGHFSAQVALDKQGTYPSEGEMLAFNGTYRGRPAILAHVYGSEPVPTSITLPFVISEARGTFGTVLTATLPRADNNFVTGLDLTLSRRYASAGCPAPRGFPGAVFPFAKASYGFSNGQKLSSTLTRSCRARG